MSFRVEKGETAQHNGVEAMNVRDEGDMLILSDPSWISTGLTCFAGLGLIALAVFDMASDVHYGRLVLSCLGVGVLLLGLFGSHHLHIVFERPSGTVTLRTRPVLPDAWSPGGARTLTRDLSTFKYAYVELARLRNSDEIKTRTMCNVALASGDIPENVLRTEVRPYSAETDESIRWIISIHSKLSVAKAKRVADAINQWMGTQPPLPQD